MSEVVINTVIELSTVALKNNLESLPKHYIPPALVITTNPRPGPLVVSLHSQANITCSVEGVDSIYWILYRPDLPYTLLQNGDDERFIISGENMETLMIVDVTEDLHESVIFCQIPYHGDIDIGHFVLLLQGIYRLQYRLGTATIQLPAGLGPLHLHT